jgi:enoyl-CoA hydratase
MEDSSTTDTNFETLLYEVDADGVCIITINRADKLNAINRQVLIDLHRAFRLARASGDVRGVILTGSGDRAFAAGADIQQFADLGAVEGQRFALQGQQVFSAIENMPKPVIAAVNGFALGGGCELAISCHLRVASSGARFGQPEVALGLIPGYGGTQRLPRLIGRGLALEMILTAERISAERAYSIGLVNQIVPAEALITSAREMLLKITSKAPLAVSMSLQAVRAADQPLHQGLQLEAALFGQVCATEDFEEGVSAFLNKRPAEFAGR